MHLKKIVESLIENFLEAGDLAIQLREKGLIKKNLNSVFRRCNNEFTTQPKSRKTSKTIQKLAS